MAEGRLFRIVGRLVPVEILQDRPVEIEMLRDGMGGVAGEGMDEALGDPDGTVTLERIAGDVRDRHDQGSVAGERIDRRRVDDGAALAEMGEGGANDVEIAVDVHVHMALPDVLPEGKSRKNS